MSEFQGALAPTHAALILQAIHHAIPFADQDCGDFQALSHWLTLIDAASSHAHYLLTGEECRG